MIAVVSLLVGVLLVVGSGTSIGSLGRAGIRHQFLIVAVFVVQGIARGRIPLAGVERSGAVMVWAVCSLALVVMVLRSRDNSGPILIAVGTMLNVLVVLLNGFMPIALPDGASALSQLGFYQPSNLGVLAPVLADVMPLRVAGLGYLLSPGDVLLSVGLVVFMLNESCSHRTGEGVELSVAK